MATYSYTSHSWPSYPKTIPANVETLYITFVGITEVPENLKEAVHIKELILTGNSITVLENLPPNLETLTCNLNKIKTVTSFPKTLKNLYVNGNELTNLENLPPHLEDLDCADNKLETIKTFPDSLIRIDCSSNLLRVVPKLPRNLKMLYVQHNMLIKLPTLPESLEVVSYYTNTNMSKLDYLPNSLTNLYKESTNRFIFDYVEKLRKILEKQRYEERIRIIKEELIAAAWHPNRVEKWLEAGFDMD